MKGGWASLGGGGSGDDLHVVSTSRDIQRNARVFPDVLWVLLNGRPAVCVQIVALDHRCKANKTEIVLLYVTGLRWIYT